MKLQGAQVKNNHLILSQTIMTDLPLVLLKWTHSQSTSSHLNASNKLTLPVYLNATRSELLFTIDVNAATGNESYHFYERGVALLTSTALN